MCAPLLSERTHPAGLGLWRLERRAAWAKVYAVLAATMQGGAAEVADLRAAE